MPMRFLPLIGLLLLSGQAFASEPTFTSIAVSAIGFPIYAIFVVVALLLLGPWPI